MDNENEQPNHSGASQNEDGILYDVSYHVEWPDEKELVRPNQLDEIPPGIIYSGVKSLKSSLSRWTWATIRAVGFPVMTGAPCMLPLDLIKLVNNHMSWSMSRSPDGNFVAVIQDGCVEIRSSKDEYNAVVGRCNFSKDPHPQWRTISWSQQSTVIAFSDSDGTVHICDIKGIVILSYHGHLAEDDNFDYSNAICALQFLQTSAIRHDVESLVLLIVSYSGAATCLEINEDFEKGYKIAFQFDFSQIHSKGVSTLCYSKDHELLIIGGCTGYAVNAVGVAKATKYGLSAWRLISDDPYIKPLDVFNDIGDSMRKHSLLRRLSTVPSDFGKKLRGEVIDGVYVMSISPCCKLLAVVHLSGAISIWEIPSLRQRRIWRNEEQPFYNETRADSASVFASPKKLKIHPLSDNTIDCKWWSDSAVIVARCSGSLAVICASGDNLESLFGDSCEWLEPTPRISFCRDEGFLAIECETNVQSLKRQRENSDNNEDNDDGDDDDDFPSLGDNDVEESSGLLQNLKNNTKSALYQWTEVEYFRPPRKRPKLVRKSYRLLGITKTTPEKLFEKRLEDEEYGEALALAQRYNLDGDKVFQRQWKKSTVSVASIQDYLRKVTKRSWVMHECCERVPDDLDAARELLKFALSVTDIDELVKISNAQDSYNNQSESDSDYEDEYDGFDVEEQRNHEIRQRNNFVKKWSKRLDLNNLTLQQKEMVRARKRVIKYMDRLSTYESLLGGYDAARERYNKERFSIFRQQNMFTSALEYARNGKWKALDTLLTFHGDELREHRLALLSNIPKTVPPSEYRCLLPFINEDESVECWPEVKHRDPEDWCEKSEYCSALALLTIPSDPAAEFYQENPSLLPFKTSNPSSDLVRDWFLYQAQLFDSDALDIDGALGLLNIGAENYVDGLEMLTKDFKTLETLVYECDYDPGLTLVKLQGKSKLEQLKMLMETSSNEMYVKNFHRWALPFLKSCDQEQERASSIFERYIKELAEDDLTLPSLIFTSFLEDYSMPVLIASTEDLSKLALDCIYMNCNPEQLNTVKKIHGALVELDKGVLKAIGSDKIEHLENHIYACSMLAGYEVKVTPEYIREVESDRMSVQKLLLRLSRTVGGREPALNKAEWKGFLKSMLQLRDKIFSKTCGLEAAICLEVFVESLLTSGNINNFQIASEHMMRTSDEEHEATRHLLRMSSQQKLSYESSVALVIKSSQEYFDASSPTTNDNMLSLARECLLLITDRPDTIREKLDLIEGVVLLQRFGVNKLPLQVRLTEDKLSLISKAIDDDDEAYKKTEPLLRLAMLFRVSGDNKNDRKGKVLTMIVEKALVQGDLDCAYCLCQELMIMPFISAWQVCLKLAKRDEFDNIDGKKDILAFVACHCDESKLPEVMEHIGSANCAILKKSMEEPRVPMEEDVVGSENEPPPDEKALEMPRMSLNKLVNSSAEFLSPVNMLKTTVKGSKAMLNATGNVLSVTGTVLSATSHTTKAVISNVKNAEWWKSTIDKTLSSIPIPDMEMDNTDEIEDAISNIDFELHGCPEFYSDLIENSVSKHGMLLSEERFFIPKHISLSQAILRTDFLHVDCNDSTTNSSDIVILEKLVEEILPYDFALGISYLLALEDLDRAYKCFKKFPVTALSLQLALYYFSLCLAKEMEGETEDDDKSSLYDVKPIELMKQALEYISTSEFGSGSRQAEIAMYMRQFQEQMYDFAQGERLQQLGRGIDVGRFTSDVEYRNETILGLAMTTDDEQYKIAVSSAHRSGTDLWLVLMTHLEYLFTECQDQLNSASLQERIDALNMTPELIKRPKDFFQRMDKCVFPFIHGKDLDQLLLYFTLLSNCKEVEKSFISKHHLCRLSPSNHVKILKKIKSVSPGLDYKALMSNDHQSLSKNGEDSVLSLLFPVLEANNVQMFAKLMPQIPYSGFSITASVIYLQIAKKFMLKDFEHGVGEESAEAINWTTRYDSCVIYLKMCCPAHLLSFFEEILYGSELSKMLPLRVRQDVIKRGVKLCKFQVTKEKKNQLDGAILSSGQSFDTVLSAFTRMSKHLDSYSTTFISNLVELSEDDHNMRKYLHHYDASQSKPEIVIELASLMLQDGAAPNFIQDFFAVVPGNSWTCKDVLNKCIESIVSDFSTLEDKDPVFDRLTAIVKTVSEHEKIKGKILTSSQVIELLRPFCSDTTIDAKLRVDVLKLLEDQFELEDSEAQLLLLHRTEAVIRESWGEAACEKVLENVGAHEIIDGQVRLGIFKNLLSMGELNIEKAKCLVSLLEIWPTFESDESRDECWHNALLIMANNGAEGGRVLIEVIRDPLKFLPLPVVKNIFQKLSEHNVTLYAIKLALLANFRELDDDLVSTVRNVTRMGPSQCDEEVIVLMLKNSFAVHTVDTLYYAKVTEYLLSGECSDAERHVHHLARQLQDQGHIAEAGTLLLNYRGTHPALRTFNNSLSSLKRWLNS